MGDVTVFLGVKLNHDTRRSTGLVSMQPKPGEKRGGRTRDFDREKVRQWQATLLCTDGCKRSCSSFLIYE